MLLKLNLLIILNLIKVTSLHDTGLGPNYITESIVESVPKVEFPHDFELGPNYLAQSIDYNKSLTKVTSPHGIILYKRICC